MPNRTPTGHPRRRVPPNDDTGSAGEAASARSTGGDGIDGSGAGGNEGGGATGGTTISDAGAT